MKLPQKSKSNRFVSGWLSSLKKKMKTIYLLLISLFFANQALANTLGGFMPVAFDQNVVITEKTPVEHSVTTNAFKTFAVEYQLEDSSRIDALAVWTKSAFYSHPGNIMLRHKGNYLLRLEAIDVMGYSFVLASYRDQEGALFYTVSYSLEHTYDNEFELYSGWTHDQFETALSIYYYELTFDNKDVVDQYLQAFVLHMDACGTVIQNETAFNCPKTFVKEFTCQGAQLNLTIHNDSPSFYAELFANQTWSNVLISNQEVKDYTIDCQIVSAQKIVLSGLTDDRDVFFIQGAQLSSNSDIEGDFEIHIFPNPVAEVLQIEGTELISTRLIDHHGRIIQVSEDPQPKFNVSQLSGGQYYVDIKTTTNRITKKVIVI